jgi:hypothetical protein
MRRNNEQAELIQRRNAESKSSVDGACRVLLRRHLRIGTMLCCALIALHGLALRTSGQDPVPRKVIIDVIKPPAQPLQYRFPGKTPQPETELEFNGNGSDWSFVKFPQLPEHATLKVKGSNIIGYDESEQLLANKWYPFKSKLPVILEIKQEAVMPVEIAFSFGSPNTSTRQKLEETPNLNARDMRKFADDNQVKQDTDRLSIKFIWGETVVPLVTPTPASVGPIVAQTPDNSWLAYFDEHPLTAILFLLIGLVVIALLGLFIVPIIFSSIRNRRRRPKRSKLKVNQAAPTDKPAAGTEMSEYDALVSGTASPSGQEADVARDTLSTSVMTVFNADTDQTLASQKQPPQEERARHLGPGERVNPSPKQPMQVVATVSQDGKKMEELGRKVGEIETMLRQKVDRQENLTEAARINVQNMLVQSEKNILAQMESRIKQALHEALKPLDDLMTEQELSVRKELDEAAGKIKEATTEGNKVKQQLAELLQELGHVEKRLQERLANLQTALDRQTEPDSFYAKTLGTVLGQNVETLQDGNFERLMGERLNQFFQSGVARGDGLQEVRARAEGINDALKIVSSQIEKLNPQASGETHSHTQRVEALVAELSSLQSQLQNRRATIETTLIIPVSMHTGARQTFLDELGRGIRREIDKLNEPESYFEGELERTITANLIAIVDICDKKVAPPPGTRPELEAALKQLFEQAGLRQILPRRGEPFKTAEQDLVEMAQGGQSLTVAQVITRGFYYKHRDNETLLRKASVTVYR